DLALTAQPRPRPQIRERPHRRLRTHLRIHRHGVVHPGTRTHPRIRRTRVRTHLTALRQMRRTVQLRPRMHHHVLLERHRHIHPRPRRIHHRHPRQQRRRQQTLVQDPPRLSQLHPVVDPRDLPVITRHRRTHPMTRRTQNPQDIRQVLLTLTVVRPHLLQRLRQQRTVEREHTRIDLTDRPLLLRRVLVLHDRRHRTRRLVPHDPPVTRRVRHLG